MLFVEANRQEVVITFASHKAPPMAIGFVVLTSALVGMICCGALCIVELLSLYIQNKKLKRHLRMSAIKANNPPSDRTELALKTQ